MRAKSSGGESRGRISNMYLEIEILTLLLISIVTVFQWFRDPSSHMIYFVDEFFPFNPSYYASHWIYAWQNYGTGWRPSAPFLPYLYAIYAFHNILHLSLQISQYLLYVIIFFATGAAAAGDPRPGWEPRFIRALATSPSLGSRNASTSRSPK